MDGYGEILEIGGGFLAVKAEDSAPRRTLESLEPGVVARIAAIPSDCDRAGRLSSLGFIPGRWVKVIRLAPLGDPISAQIDGQEISLRRSEARLIVLEPSPVEK